VESDNLYSCDMSFKKLDRTRIHLRAHKREREREREREPTIVIFFLDIRRFRYKRGDRVLLAGWKLCEETSLEFSHMDERDVATRADACCTWKFAGGQRRDLFFARRESSAVRIRWTRDCSRPCSSCSLFTFRLDRSPRRRSVPRIEHATGFEFRPCFPPLFFIDRISKIGINFSTVSISIHLFNNRR